MWLLHWLEGGVSWGFFVFELPFLLLLHIFILRVSYVYPTCILRVSYVSGRKNLQSEGFLGIGWICYSTLTE